MNRNALALRNKQTGRNASGIQRQTIVNAAPKNHVGPSARAAVETTMNRFTLRFENATGSKVTKIVGDPDNLIAALFTSDAIGGTFSDADGGTPINIAAWKKSLGANPITIQQMNLSVSGSGGDATQFDNDFIVATGDHNRSRASYPMVIADYLRNNQQIETRLTLSFDPQEYITLDAFRAMYFDLNANTNLAITFSLAFAAGRA